MENKKDNKDIGFLFDLDGVIIDSEKEYTRIWEAIDKAHPTGVENFAYVIKGQTLARILDPYFPDPDVQKDVVRMLNEMEQRMRHEMLPGALKTLEALQRDNLPRVLVTSSNNLKMKHLREEQPALEGMFSDIVTADRISHSKPDPEGYLLGARLCGCKPERCAVFEDSAQGVEAGHRAGCFVVGLTTTLPAASLEPFADRIVSSLDDVDLSEIKKILENR